MTVYHPHPPYSWPGFAWMLDHLPMFDIDMPAMLLRSTTRNHYHLYINKPMTWENYVKLLDVMAEVGIVEKGYVAASKERGYASLRPPWVKK